MFFPRVSWQTSRSHFLRHVVHFDKYKITYKANTIWFAWRHNNNTLLSALRWFIYRPSGQGDDANATSNLLRRPLWTLMYNSDLVQFSSNCIFRIHLDRLRLRYNLRTSSWRCDASFTVFLLTATLRRLYVDIYDFSRRPVSHDVCHSNIQAPKCRTLVRSSSRDVTSFHLLWLKKVISQAEQSKRRDV